MTTVVAGGLKTFWRRDRYLKTLVCTLQQRVRLLRAVCIAGRAITVLAFLRDGQAGRVTATVLGLV